MILDDLSNSDYLGGAAVAPSVKQARIIEILETVNEACISCANDQFYDVWISQSNEVIIGQSAQLDGAINLAASFKVASSKLHDLIATITDCVFDSNTEGFKGLAMQFQFAAKDVMEKIEQLNSIGASIKTAVEIVDIVDEVISTAAALTKF